MNNFIKSRNAIRNLWRYDKTKLNHDIKDQFTIIILYTKVQKENIPEEIENAYTVQFL